MYFPQIDEAIKVYLARSGRTQFDLAKEMGISSNTFSWKRRGIREFTLSEVVKLGQIIGKEPSELVSNIPISA